MGSEAAPLASSTTSKVASLRPDSQGLDLVVKVINKNVVLDRQSTRVSSNTTSRIAECTVGDSTGVIVLVAKNEQVDLVQEGQVLLISNARIDMFKGSMRLAVGQNGSIEESSEKLADKVNVDHNLSLIEFESVLLPAQNGLAA